MARIVLGIERTPYIGWSIPNHRQTGAEATPPREGASLGVSGHAEVVEDAAEEVVGGEALGLGLVAGDDPVAQDVAGEALDVVGGDVVAAGEQGVTLGRLHQRQGG